MVHINYIIFLHHHSDNNNNLWRIKNWQTNNHNRVAFSRTVIISSKYKLSFDRFKI